MASFDQTNHDDSKHRNHDREIMLRKLGEFYNDKHGRFQGSRCCATDAFRSQDLFVCPSNAEHSPACVRVLIAHPELKKTKSSDEQNFLLDL
jgi:hypothetical protein